MVDRIVANVFDLCITTKCTLKCMNCVACIPYITNQKHSSKEVVFREIEEFFNVFDYAGRIEIIGGEPLLHPDLLEIVKKAVKYKSQYGFLRITTNCTIEPRDDLLEYIKNCGVHFDFILGDYGEPSIAYTSVKKKIDEYNIPNRTDKYHGNKPHFNGWIDFGDHSYKNYEELELAYIFTNCTAAKHTFFATWEGNVHPCVHSLAGQTTGRLESKLGEWIDLFDESMTLEQKRVIAVDFLKKPLNACRYCNGFLSEIAPRIQAGKQL